MKILVCPGNIQSAKSYPHWSELLTMLESHEVKQIGGILKKQDIIDLVNWCDTWVSIDSFLPHFAAYHKLKKGIVLWGKGNPLIFGYEHNINLVKDSKYFRRYQYRWWIDHNTPANNEVHDPDSFVLPQVVYAAIKLLA